MAENGTQHTENEQGEDVFDAVMGMVAEMEAADALTDDALAAAVAAWT